MTPKKYKITWPFHAESQKEIQSRKVPNLWEIMQCQSGRRLVGIDYESHRDTKRVFHESLSLVNNYQRETMIELTLVKIETEGCTESIADVHRQVRGSRL